MKVAHVGPPLARQGGPAGYLLQLSHAASQTGAPDEVSFPLPAPRVPAPPRRPAWRRTLSSARAAIAPPRRYRPSDAALGADHGHVESMVSETIRDQLAEAHASFEAAFDGSADVVFCHDAAVAEQALERRRAGQAVWLMVHAPMTLALYLAWSWGVPEWDWRDVAGLPDVARWSAWEARIWQAVDRLIVPCRAAFGELVRVQPSAVPLMNRLTCILSGASLPSDPRTLDRADARRRFGLPLDQPLGLFLGNNQPYRGLDTLLASLEPLGRAHRRGILVVAGPPTTAVRSARRLRSLGPVSDVAALLAAVDFVINVNRFSLFDLSTIEALQAGKPLLLHACGGNVTFEELGAGCVMVPSLQPAAIADGLTRMFEMSPDQLAAMGRDSRRCYEQHLTLAAFWRRHADLYAAAVERPKVTA